MVNTVEFDVDGLRLVGDDVRPIAGSEPERGWVLLLHGGGQTRHSWSHTSRRLASDGWRAIAVDARGHGDSSWSEDGSYTLDAMSADVAAIIEQVGEPPVLMGASMGGMASLIAEGELGPLARGLVLVDIVPRPDPVGIARITSFMASAPNGYASLDEVADAIAAYTSHRARTRNLDSVRKNVRQRADGRWYWHWDPRFLRITDEPARSIPAERAEAAARRIRVPTLLVRGESSDVVSADGAEQLRRLIPGAIVQEARAGHMVAGDDNDVFTKHVLEFLATLPPPA